MNPETEPAECELIEADPMARNCAHLKKRIEDPALLNMVEIKEETLRRFHSAIGYDDAEAAKIAGRRLVDLPFQPDWTKIPKELDFRRRVTRRGPPARKRFRLDDRMAIERRLQALQVIELEGEEPDEQEHEPEEEDNHPDDLDEREEKDGELEEMPAAAGDHPPSDEDELEEDNDHDDYDVDDDDGYDSAPDLG